VSSLTLKPGIVPIWVGRALLRRTGRVPAHGRNGDQPRPAPGWWRTHWRVPP